MQRAGKFDYIVGAIAVETPDDARVKRSIEKVETENHPNRPHGRGGDGAFCGSAKKLLGLPVLLRAIAARCLIHPAK